jgi:hypothetical protein
VFGFVQPSQDVDIVNASYGSHKLVIQAHYDVVVGVLIGKRISRRHTTMMPAGEDMTT